MGNQIENKGKSSTVFYHEWLDLIEDFSDEEAGQLLKAVLLFDRDGAKTTFQDRAMKVAYKQMVSIVEHNREKYENICEKRRESINKRYQKSTNEHKSIQVNTNVTDNDNEYDNDNVNVNEYVNDNDNDNESGGGGDSGNVVCQPPQPPLSENDVSVIVEAWNLQNCTHNIKVIFNGSKRMQNTLRCINGNFAAFIDVIRDLDNQRYLSGKDINYDWFVEPPNFQKVAEGNYKDLYGAKSKGSTRESIMALD